MRVFPVFSLRAPRSPSLAPRTHTHALGEGVFLHSDRGFGERGVWGSTGVVDKGVDGDEDAVANAVWRELRGRVHCADAGCKKKLFARALCAC